MPYKIYGKNYLVNCLAYKYFLRMPPSLSPYSCASTVTHSWQIYLLWKKWQLYFEGQLLFARLAKARFLMPTAVSDASCTTSKRWRQQGRKTKQKTTQNDCLILYSRNQLYSFWYTRNQKHLPELNRTNSPKHIKYQTTLVCILLY